MSAIRKAQQIENRIARLERDIMTATRKTQDAIAGDDLAAYQKWDRIGRKLGRKQDRLRRKLRRYVGRP